MRLPVESAKKLRWFDRQDINMLMQVGAGLGLFGSESAAPHTPSRLKGKGSSGPGMEHDALHAGAHATPLLPQLHLREKQELFEANGALRQVLRRAGVADAQLGAELQLINSQVDAMRQQEEGVNQVLVLAAQVGDRGEGGGRSGAERPAGATAAASECLFPGGDGTHVCSGLRCHLGATCVAQAEVEALREQLDTAQHELQHVRQQQLQLKQQQQQHALQPRANSGGLASQLQQPPLPGETESVSLQLQFPEPSSDSRQSGVTVRLLLQPSSSGAGGSLSRDAAASLPAALAGLVEAAAATDSCSVGPAADPMLLMQTAAALSRLAAVAGVALPGLNGGGAQSAADGSATSNGSSGAAGGGGGVGLLEQRCAQQEAQLARLQGELAAVERAQQDAAFGRESAERKLAEMRSRLAEAQQRQGEVLRVAQDSRLEAGE